MTRSSARPLRSGPAVWNTRVRASARQSVLRFTWDASDPAVITWRNEVAIGDGSWFLIEEYAMVPQ